MSRDNMLSAFETHYLSETMANLYGLGIRQDSPVLKRLLTGFIDFGKCPEAKHHKVYQNVKKIAWVKLPDQLKPDYMTHKQEIIKEDKYEKQFIEFSELYFDDVGEMQIARFNCQWRPLIESEVIKNRYVGFIRLQGFGFATAVLISNADLKTHVVLISLFEKGTTSESTINEISQKKGHLVKLCGNPSRLVFESFNEGRDMFLDYNVITDTGLSFPQSVIIDATVLKNLANRNLNFIKEMI